MDKSSGQKEALRLWRALPLLERQNHRQAVAFAARIAPTLQFETLGNHDKIVEGWLVRDLLQTEEALRLVDAKARQARPKQPLKEKA